MTNTKDCQHPISALLKNATVGLDGRPQAERIACMDCGAIVGAHVVERMANGDHVVIVDRHPHGGETGTMQQLSASD